MSQIRAIHQLLGKSTPGYSVSNYALALQDALQQWDFHSIIYASEVAPELGRRVQPLRKFRPRPNELLILHYVMANEVTAWLKQYPKQPLILSYHNVTPPYFFTGIGGQYAQGAAQSQSELKSFQAQTRLALTFSHFSRQDLEIAGYTNIKTIPLLMPTTLQKLTPHPGVISAVHTSPNLLFVGRIAPNKRCEDVIKILHQYRQIEPAAHLYLVGPTHHTQPYTDWLYDFVHQYDVEDAVTFTGYVSDTELAAYYRQADIFIMMSEHEGFGIPLVEAMRFGLPVVAYKSTAVSETMGGAGILIQQKRYDVIAALIQKIYSDTDLRQKIVQSQRKRIQAFAPEQVLSQLHAALEDLL
ncbi:Glycosyltransferase [hydrothermal vent metagenome]|uniref:Glycosyltransferase n=1 Tax=hydrothermal vent metagenome TaxID=652676 RepID=A0A3B0W118_9ZZZZ